MASPIHNTSVIPEGKNRDDYPTLHDLFSNNFWGQYGARWKDLGAALGLEDYYIAVIAKDHPNDVVSACIAMLRNWLQTGSSPTWGELDDAIKMISGLAEPEQLNLHTPLTSVIPEGKHRDDFPTLSDLYRNNFVEQFAARWKDLGAALGLEDYHIAIVSKDHPNNVVSACIEMFRKWLQTGSSPTWGELDDAIKMISGLTKPGSTNDTGSTETNNEFDQKTINAYREALKKGSRSSNQFKLVTLGAEGAGKTSTINTLMGEEFQPNQKTTVGASISSCKVARSMATSKWQKITATARVAEIPRQRRGEMKAQIALISLDPTPQSAPVKPEVHQKAVKDLKEIMATQDIKKDETRIIVFDIGGQEVYYEIHFLFLAVEDVALLVFKASIGLHTPVDPRAHSQKVQEKIAVRGMRTNLQTMDVLMQSVYSRGKKAPEGSISPRVPVVLMVGAHAEDVSTEEQEKMIEEIQEHFSGTPLLEHLPQSSKDCFYFIANSKPDQKVVNHLRSTVLKAVQWVICIDRPISYLSFEEKILDFKEVRIEKTKAVTIAKEAGIEEEHNINALLDYYTKKGILLYFPELKLLRNEVFLLPEEVSDLVCMVITTLDCYPHTGDLQQSYVRYQKYALLEGPLFDYMLSHYKRLKDKNVILGLLEKFSLAARVPPKTKFPGEISFSEPTEVYMVPSLLVYNQTNEFHVKGSDDIAVVFYFGGKFLPETIFNKLLVRIIHWCYEGKTRKHHEIKCINRGFGYFLFENGLWQSFKLQLCQSSYSIKCYINVTNRDSRQPPTDLLQQRQDLLAFLTSSIKELSSPHMPESKLPVTCLECPFHEDDPPHIKLDINRREDLVCNFGSTVQLVDEKYYAAIFDSIVAPQNTNKIDCATAIDKIQHCYVLLTSLPIKSMLPQLHCDKVITIDQKKRIEARQLESEGVQFFLDDVLLLSLRLDMTNIYSSFVGVLKKSGDPIQCEMAKKIALPTMLLSPEGSNDRTQESTGNETRQRCRHRKCSVM
ncbi:uncharacterized protein [Dysidea avara]|uniref:uncharacterized protein isoform X2 n=1 Tax=Dysidea avara TaxID=196820 RepID=UPI0033259E9D